MSAWMCRSTKPLGRIVCPLLIAGTLAGCSSFKSFGKKDEMPKDETAVAEEHRKNSFKELDQPIRVHMAYAQWREEIGDLKSAREHYEAVLKSQPKNSEAQLGMARIAYHTGQVEQAEQKFQQVLSASGGKPKVLDEVAQFYAEQNRWKESAQLLERAVQAEPENADYRYHYGVSLAYAGDMRRAYDQFQSVMTEAESFYNLGYILREQGNVQSAEQHLVRSLQLKPDMVQARNLLSEMHSNALQPVRNERTFRQVSGTSTGVQAQPQIQPQIQPQRSRQPQQIHPQISDSETDSFQLPVQQRQPATGAAAPFPSQGGYRDPTPFGQ